MRILLVPSGSIVNDQLGEETRARCDRATELWQSGEYDLIVVSGGLTERPETQSIPAGTIMREYLRKQGVNGMIIVENEARDTFENILFTIDSFQGIGGLTCNEITVVTEWQHGLRFQISFYLGYGIKVRVAPVKFRASLRQWCREWIYLVYHLLDPKGTGYFARLNRQNRSR